MEYFILGKMKTLGEGEGYASVIEWSEYSLRGNQSSNHESSFTTKCLVSSRKHLPALTHNSIVCNNIYRAGWAMQGTRRWRVRASEKGRAKLGSLEEESAAQGKC